LERILGTDGKEGEKLGRTNWLWDRDSLDKGNDNCRQKDADIETYRLPDLEAVFY